jgi:CheY-like chemotaxis protein
VRQRTNCGIGNRQYEFMLAHPSNLEHSDALVAKNSLSAGDLPRTRRVSRIFVVDDHPDIADALALLIGVASPSPVTTSVAYSGAQAIESAEALRPVVLLDVDVPVMNGVEAAIELRNMFPEQAPLIIALTGNGQHRESAIAQAAFVRILVKPVDVDLLMNTIWGIV